MKRINQKTIELNFYLTNAEINIFYCNKAERNSMHKNYVEFSSEQFSIRNIKIVHYIIKFVFKSEPFLH